MRTNAVELDSSVFLDLPIDGAGEVQSHVHPPQLEPVGKLKCGMWTSFAIATIFVVAGAKFFIDHRVCTKNLPKLFYSKLDSFYNVFILSDGLFFHSVDYYT